jgi:flagellar motor switch protein FliG
MQKILASVETQTLSLALKGSSKEVEANIMENLSSRVREMVADERELAGAVPLADVQAARSEVMTAVRALMDAGDFTPARAGQEMVS